MMKYRLSTPTRHRIFILATTGIAALIIGTALAFSVADALTVTSRAETDQELTVVIGDESAPLVIEPTQTIEGVCQDGCVIIHPNGDELELEGTEIVLIDEDGFRFED